MAPVSVSSPVTQLQKRQASIRSMSVPGAHVCWVAGANVAEISGRKRKATKEADPLFFYPSKAQLGAPDSLAVWRVGRRLLSASLSCGGTVAGPDTVRTAERAQSTRPHAAPASTRYADVSPNRPTGPTGSQVSQCVVEGVGAGH